MKSRFIARAQLCTPVYVKKKVTATRYLFIFSLSQVVKNIPITIRTFFSPSEVAGWPLLSFFCRKDTINNPPERIDICTR